MDDPCHRYGSTMTNLPLNRLIQDKLSLVLSFALSRREAADFRKRFSGPWPIADRVLHTFPEEQATAALMEVALFFRTLDDREQYSTEFKGEDFGTVTKNDGTIAVLNLRDVSNKIIHNLSLEWNFDSFENPKIISHGDTKENWTRAEIHLIPLIALLILLAGIGGRP
jgi:hypothetical protein